jgi:PPK2 family polyphosphate:nucleotide phosphotransferase
MIQGAAQGEGRMDLAKRGARLAERYRITKGGGFTLSAHDPADTAGLAIEKTEAKALLTEGIARLAAQQDRLYAQNRWAVLVIFQAMDAAGKDGAIKHVFSGINPQGVAVTSFKAPSPLERDHDFLWRHALALPRRGEIAIHNRSWYEEVLVARVHPELIAGQNLPEPCHGRHFWKHRLRDIAAHEAYLARQGVVILKFFLHLSEAEQRRRFLARIDAPEKNWKFSAADVAERRHWRDYQRAYQAAIRATAAPHAPWFVVPADNKWFTRIVVAAALTEALEGLGLHYPEIDAAGRDSLLLTRAELLAQKA